MFFFLFWKISGVVSCTCNQSRPLTLFEDRVTHQLFYPLQTEFTLGRISKALDFNLMFVSMKWTLDPKRVLIPIVLVFISP